MSKHMPQPGHTLPNGATVAVSLPHPTDHHTCYVGAKTTGPHPFVTWECSINNQSTYLGHYFETASDMLIDLLHRAGLEV